MSNLVLYRKYRPKNFSEVAGQNHVIKTITNAISSGKISHGYLFSGPHGCGKTTTARLIAKSLNCKKREEGKFEPCNSCESCKEINNNSAVDLIEIDAASNRGIDEIRKLKEGVEFLPAKAKYKVFIIDEAHQLTKEASNALLKTLEEPPAHAIFILATTEPHKMINTIISRCQRFDFRKLTLKEIKETLKEIIEKEQVKCTDEALDLICLAANGSVRDAETLLNQLISFVGDEKIDRKAVEDLLGIAEIEMVFDFLELLIKRGQKESIEFLNKIVFEGIDLHEFTDSTIKYLREILLLKIDPEREDPHLATLSQENQKRLKELRDEISNKELPKIIKIISEAKKKMKNSSVLQLPLELAIVEICDKTS